MEKWLYQMTIIKTKLYNRLNKAAVERHVENIRRLDEAGKLELCGVYKGYKGVAGMYLLKADSYEEAEELCKQEPLVVEGFATYQLYALRMADKENNYLL
ncbi:hypothetical protein NRIC_20140 [Enterococcus florum]|uniref:YCII-related domain-containing protein n=1 Tax=Enterococcus florum TaxID=2480627 RepID=A0A4P5PLH2_9ENTE|nr:YciI family protein [Enterococcus florum]GCF94123.1 hypothetical protein NRIC_20140 [Enterococcus florum]